MEAIRRMLPPPTKTGPRGSKQPAKRPAQPSSQDTSMHPPKKQRLEGAQKDGKGVAKVASAGAGARAAGGKVKRKDGLEKTGEKGDVVAAEGLIPTAPGVAVEATAESSSNPAPKQKEVVTNGAETSNAAPAAASAVPLTTTKSVTSNQTTANAAQTDSKNVTGTTKPTQGAKPTKKNPPKTPAGDTATSHGKQLKTARRMQPMKPLATDGQSALGRPKKASGSGPTRGIAGRDVVFVTRKTSLGSYMRRCKALLVEDGLNQITLHALCVAIPHAVMLLYALTDILPFPRQFIHHEIQTSSVECHDEMSLVAAELEGAKVPGKDKGKGKAKALAIFEEDEAGNRSRTKSGIRIIIRIGKGARVSQTEHENPSSTSTTKNAHKARPNKVQRIARRDGEEQVAGEGDQDMGQAGETVEEEERMNEETSAAAAPAKVDPPNQSSKGAAKDTSRRKQPGNQSPSGQKKQKVKGKQKPRISAAAMDVD